MINKESINIKVEKTYKDLNVFKLSYDLGLRVHKLTLKFPDFERHSLGNQLRRSSMSIPVNLAEGMSKQSSSMETIRFLKIAIGSCEETKVWLNYAFDLGYINQEYYDLVNQYEEVGKMLNGLIKYWKLKE